MRVFLPVLVNRTEFIGKTSIFKLFLDTGHKVLPSQFEIISFTDENNVFMLESIFIHHLKPSLDGSTLYAWFTVPSFFIQMKTFGLGVGQHQVNNHLYTLLLSMVGTIYCLFCIGFCNGFCPS